MLTTDEWTYTHARKLRDDLETHFSVYGIHPEDMEPLLRLCMISVRDWAETPKEPKNENRKRVRADKSQE